MTILAGILCSAALFFSIFAVVRPSLKTLTFSMLFSTFLIMLAAFLVTGSYWVFWVAFVFLLSDLIFVSILNYATIQIPVARMNNFDKLYFVLTISFLVLVSGISTVSVYLSEKSGRNERLFFGMDQLQPVGLANWHILMTVIILAIMILIGVMGLLKSRN